AALRFLERKNGDQRYDVFNVGTGNGYSVLEAIHAFEKATGVALPYQIGNRRAGDIEQVWGDVSKSSEQLQWKAEHGIEEMMRSAWAWEKYLRDEDPFSQL